MSCAVLTTVKPMCFSVQAPVFTQSLTLVNEIVRLISPRIEGEDMYKSITLDAKYYFCSGFVSCEDRYVKFIEPVRINVDEQDGYFYASIPETGLVVAELDYGMMKLAVEEFLAEDYCEYAFTDDEYLTENAQDIKRWFLSNTAPCEPTELVG